MGAVRVMFIGQGPSGLPEDRVVNTFHFEDAVAVDPGDLAACSLAVADFYGGPGVGDPPQSHSIGWYISPWVSRTAELRAYNLDQPKPRVPYITPIALEGGSTGNGMPEEVCVCLTLHGAPPNTPRRRGRIYMGPLAMSAVALADMDNPSRPSGAFTADLCTAAVRLANSVRTPKNWSIRSVTPTENYVPIVSGYVDNALDTQTRRGPDTTNRTPWIASS